MHLYKPETAMLEDLAKHHRDRYVTGNPFPHIYIDNIFPEEVLNTVLDEFPDARQINWQHYQNKQELKLASRNELEFGTATRHFIHTLNSKPFLHFLEELTGIRGLIPDPLLRAAACTRSCPVVC